MLSFSVVTNILFFSSVAIVVLKVIFRNDNVILRLDVRFVLLCLLLVVFRLSIPVESPLVSRIPVFKLYPEAYRFMREPLFEWIGVGISRIEILTAGWIVGALVWIVKRGRVYYLTARQIRSYRLLRNPEFDMTVEKINGEWGKGTKFRLVTAKSETVPCVFGVFRPYIVVPDRNYSSKEIYYILKHEMLHFYRGDMAIRILCEILKSVYWWNPLIYVLANLVVDMQEINVDFEIIRKLPDLEQLDYSDCLVSAIRADGYRKRNPYMAGLKKGSPSVTHKRIGLMLKSLNMSGRKTVASIMLSVLVICLITLCPSVFIFEPYSIPEADIEGSAGIEDGGICYLKNSDGTYSVYINGQYFTTVTKVFDKEIQIYDNITEVKGND